jgi:general secretion pathway protein K
VTEEGERRFTPAQQQFMRLLLTIEEPRLTPSDAEALTDAIGDWLDEDGNPRPRGAEDDAYYVRSPTHRVGNGPMASITELRKVLGMTPELYEVLAPLITVWPSEWQPLNIHTASMPLLRTIRIDDSLEPLSLSVATQLLQQREETGFGSAEEFLQQPLFGEGDSAEALTLIGETSSWFLLTAQVEIADRQMHLYSVLQRDGTSVRPLLRSRGAL